MVHRVGFRRPDLAAQPREGGGRPARPTYDVLTVIYRRRSVDHSQVDVLGSREQLDLWLDRLDLG